MRCTRPTLHFTDRQPATVLRLYITLDHLNIIFGRTFDRHPLGNAVSHLVRGVKLFWWHGPLSDMLTEYSLRWIYLITWTVNLKSAKPADLIRAFCISAKLHLRWWLHLSFLDSGRNSCLSHHYCASVTWSAETSRLFLLSCTVERPPHQTPPHICTGWLACKRHSPLQKPYYPCCILNRLISLLMWDLGVFKFIEGADTDQDVFAVHGLSPTSGW